MNVESHVTGRVLPRSQAGRIATYLAEMFTPQVMVTFCACHFLAVWFTLQALGGVAPVRLTWVSMRGIVTLTLFMLLMRLYDEMKDVDTDIRLGRAGDPLYRDRAIVTGAVRIEDIKLLRWVVTALLVAINLRTGFSWASLGFWVTFVVAWCSFQWFFWPRMSEYLLVAFVTHNPISLLLQAYVVGLFADTFGADRLNLFVLPLLGGLWFPIAAWELSRKIRVPEDETSYRTYSRVLGWKVAAILPAVFVIGSAGLLLVVSNAAGLGLVFSLVIVLTAGAVVFRCLLFRVAPSRSRAQLKPWAVLYAATSNAAVAVAAAAVNGVTW
jgi:4-hydroxybenzoate polyprenyltransferase